MADTSAAHKAEPLTCSACHVILDTDHGYRDDQGRVLCVPCYWRAVSA